MINKGVTYESCIQKSKRISNKIKESTVVAMIKANDDRIYKNGFMPTKLIAAIGEERKAIVDKIAADNNL